MAVVTFWRWVVVPIDVPRRNERVFGLSGLFGGGVGGLTVLQNQPEQAVRGCGDAKKEEGIWVVAFGRRHPDESYSCMNRARAGGVPRETPRP